MEDWFVHWFDADYLALYAHRDEAEATRAVRTALAVAPELAHGPVLDLACGTGRHLAELHRHNPSAFGLDLSRELLVQAPEALRPRLLRGDMRALPFRAGSLAGVTLWFTPFGYFGEAENRRLLHQIQTLLRPGGVLLLDYLNALRVRAHLIQEDTLEQGDLRVSIRRGLEGHRLVKRMRLERRETGAVREVVESLRLYDPAEMEGLLEEAGFRTVCVLGDYSGRPFDPARSARWLALAKSRAGES